MATTKTTKKAAAPKAPRAKKVMTDAAHAPTEVQVYSMAGKKVSTISLPADVFGAQWRADLVHQVTTALQANKRQNRAHTKDRSEVAGGGKKPWKQKGTGQARHGSTRSPIWRHGGIAFGPRNTRDYSEKINRKAKAQALVSVLSRKAKDGEIIFIDKLTFGAPKTAEAVKVLAAIGKAAEAKLLSSNGGNSALVALSNYDANAVKSFRNMQGVHTEEVRNLNPLEVLSYRYLVIENPESAFKALGARAK
jgi:large subunit ribosomal protein L4